MPTDLPPNLVGSPPHHEERRFVQEQEKRRKKEEEERQRAIDADLRLKAQQTQQTK